MIERWSHFLTQASTGTYRRPESQIKHHRPTGRIRSNIHTILAAGVLKSLRGRQWQTIPMRRPMRTNFAIAPLPVVRSIPT
ncbi:hypothetical protein M404DRAFT_316199 [Pisolithus tinctorius Marx 270]|uniref:Transposase n=1 Tax=Pisolithus tinctorius Marx 270 TaxID=870435 RepID=A0A0C3JCQ2_PISTI|nr:hypothetical protein M404DRAFT_316199 [Pisolithus tinctorius Marx 270]